MPAPKNSVVIRGVGRCNQSPRSRGGGANLAPASEPRRGAVGRARSRVRIGPAPPVTIAHFSFVGLKKMRCGDRPTRTTVALHPSRSSRHSTRCPASTKSVSVSGEVTVHLPKTATSKSAVGCHGHTSIAHRGSCSTGTPRPTGLERGDLVEDLGLGIRLDLLCRAGGRESGRPAAVVGPIGRRWRRTAG